MDQGKIVTSQERKSLPNTGVFFSFRHTLSIIVSHIIAICFWSYISAKLFFIDVDILILKVIAPNCLWLLNYKFIFILGLITVLSYLKGSKYIFGWIIYILIYPAFLVCYLIFLIFKNKRWGVMFAIVNTTVCFFQSFRYFISSLFLFCISIITIVFTTNRVLIVLAIFILLSLLVISYFRKILYVIKPPKVFQIYSTFLYGLRKHGEVLFKLDDSIKSIPVGNLTGTQIEKRTSNLQLAVLFNRFCLFFAKKLRDYQNSEIRRLSTIFTTLLLIVITIFAFTYINYGVYKIDPNSFATTQTPNLFLFFYYSFNNFIFNAIKEINANAAIAQSVYMLECFMALLVGLIFVSILIPIRDHKNDSELNLAIKAIEKHGSEMEIFIKDEYKLNSIDEAIAEIEKIKVGFLKLLNTISERLD